MKHRISRFAALTLAGCVLIGTGIAGASTAQPRGRLVRATIHVTKKIHLARPAAHAAPGKSAPRQGAGRLAPPGYVVVNSGVLIAPAGVQTTGTASCPAGKVILGGGVVISSSDLGANVNSSFPESSTSWRGDVNNASGSDTTFEVIAICTIRPGNYAIVSVGYANPAGDQTIGATAQCPANRKLLSGGALSNSAFTSVNMNSTLPTPKRKWRVDMNNGSATDTSFVVYAVCGNARGYLRVVGASVTNAAFSQTGAGVDCPSPKVPVGGGVASSSDSTAVNINSSFPSSMGWSNAENNNTSADESITPYVVCAGV